MTSNKQTQGFGRVVFAISTLVACEVALLSQKVIKLIQTIQPDLSNPTWCVGRRSFFLAKTLGKSLFHGQNDWSGHGPPASSDFWKAPLNENFHFGGQQCSVATLLALNASLIARVETNFAILMTIIRHLKRRPRSYVSGENGYRKRSFAKTLFRVEIFENAGFSFSFGRTKTEVFEYDDVKYHIYY